MDVGNSNQWQPDEVVSAAEIIAAIAERWPLQPLAPERAGEVASRYRYLDGAGEIGVIHSVSKPFCNSCTRARMSAEGKLYTCLFATKGVDLRAMLRAGVDDQELEASLRTTWSARSDRYSAERAYRRAANKIEMSYIGG